MIIPNVTLHRLKTESKLEVFSGRINSSQVGLDCVNTARLQTSLGKDPVYISPAYQPFEDPLSNHYTPFTLPLTAGNPCKDSWP